MEYRFFQIGDRIVVVRNEIDGSPMEYALGRLGIAALCAGFGLYFVWKLMERIDYRVRQRRAKRREQAGNDSICRWGIDSEGNPFCIRIRRPPKR